MSEPQPLTTAPSKRGLWAVAALALLLWLGFTLPLATGARTLYLRDVFTSHLPAKAFGAAQLRQGSIPAFDPTCGLGMPFRGNPNTLPFYPGNLLYLVLPFWSAFNLHYALHWLLAGLGMVLLARRLGLGPAGALLAALAYAGSGWIFSLLSFANLLAVAAWWPFVLAGAVQGGRRGIALGGIACGLALLGGEPITAALSLGPLLLLAWSRHGLKRGLGTAIGIGLLGLLVALPQIVASARVISFTARVALAEAGGLDRFHLGGERFLELLLPFPFGLPWNLEGDIYHSWSGQPGLPYVFTIYFGIVALWLAGVAARHRRAWAAGAALGFLLAWLGGLGGDLLARLSAGIGRYPEKFLVWPALLLPLLAGRGLEVVAASRRWRGAALGAGALVAAALLVVAAARPLSDWLAAGRVDPHTGEQGPAARVVAWTLALLLAAGCLACAALAARRGSGAGLALAQLASLLPLAGLAATAPVSDFQPSSWAERFPPGTQLATSGITGQLKPPGSPGTEEIRRYVDLSRLQAFDLGPASGGPRGWGYPLAADLVGLNSPLTDLLLYNVESLDRQALGNWLRVFGISAVVADAPLEALHVQEAASQPRLGGTSHLFLVREPAPPAWWPTTATLAPDPVAALRAVGRAEDPVAGVVVSRPVDHRPGARVEVLRETPDEIEVAVESPGGILALRRTYQPLYRASSAGRPLRTQPIDLSLLGVEVPPGNHRVRIEVSGKPEAIAGGIALAALLGALWIAGRTRGEVEGGRRPPLHSSVQPPPVAIAQTDVGAPGARPQRLRFSNVGDLPPASEL